MPNSLIVNGFDVELTDIDTLETVEKRIAFQLDTHHLLVNVYNLKLVNGFNVEAVSFIDLMKNVGMFGFIEVYEKYTWRLGWLELFRIWLEYFDARQGENYELLRDGLIADVENKFGKIDIHALTDKWGYEKKKDAFIKSTRKMLEHLIILTELVPVTSTEFTLERIEFVLKFDPNGLDVSELFNRLRVNMYIPFAAYQEFYKLHTGVTHLGDNWSVVKDDTIILRVLSRPEVGSKFLPKQYSEAYIQVNDGVGYLGLVTAVDYRSSVNALVDRIMGSWGDQEFKYGELSEIAISGVYYIENINVRPLVWADMSMNDDLISSFIYSDESVKVTKSKSGFSFYIELPGIPKARLVIDSFEDGSQLQSNFSKKKPVTRLKIYHAKTSEHVAKIMKVVNSIIRRYIVQEPDVIREYQSIIPEFEAEYLGSQISSGDIEDAEVEMVIHGQANSLKSEAYRQLIESKTKRNRIRWLRAIAGSKIIPPSYSRSSCPADRLPIIITPEYAAENARKFAYTMTYPKTNGYIWACDSSKNKYPGIGISKRELDSDSTSYTPCCFHVDQRASIPWRQYFMGEKVEKTKVVSRVLITDKILGVGDRGHIRPEIADLVKVFTPPGMSEYYRIGVGRSRSSLVEAVYTAIGRLDGKSNNAKIRMSESFRVKSLGKYAPLCRQSGYDMSIAEIKALITNPKQYLDPALAIEAVSSAAKVNIFTFGLENYRGRATAIQPRTIGYYRKWEYDTTLPWVVLYVHKGSERDYSKYPQVAIIGRSVGKTVQMTFKFDDGLIQGLTQFEQRMFGGWFYNKPTSLSTHLPFKVKAQVFDPYGKVRGLVVNIDPIKRDIYVETSPLPAFNVPEIPSLPINESIDGIAEALIEMKIGTIHTEEKGMVWLMHGQDKLRIKSKIPVIDEDMDAYTHLKRIARYIVEYYIWLFSEFVNKKSINTQINIYEDTDLGEALKEFNKDLTTVIPGHHYPIMPRTFSTKTEGVMRNGRLIADSEETLRRLTYCCWIFVRRRDAEFISYRNRRTIKDYYVDVSDFDSHPSQLVVIGEPSLHATVQRTRRSYTVEALPYMSDIDPFFLMYQDEVYIAQPAISTESALRIAYQWRTTGINPGIYPTHMTTIEDNYEVITHSGSKVDREGAGEPLDVALVYANIGSERTVALLQIK